MNVGYVKGVGDVERVEQLTMGAHVEGVGGGEGVAAVQAEKATWPGGGAAQTPTADELLSLRLLRRCRTQTP